MSARTLTPGMERVLHLYPLIAEEFRKAQQEASGDYPSLLDLHDDDLLGLASCAAWAVARSEGLEP